MKITLKQVVSILIVVYSNMAFAEDAQPTTAFDKLLEQHRQASQESTLQQGIHAGLNIATSKLQNDIFEVLGTDITPVTTEFNGQTINYQFQNWQIKPKSICSDVTQNIALYSECSQAAKELFQATCKELKKEADKFITNPKLRKVSNMYCNAAVEFKPIIAQISKSKPITDKVKKLRQECNSLIITAMISGSTKDMKERDKACEAYKKASK